MKFGCGVLRTERCFEWPGLRNTHFKKYQPFMPKSANRIFGTIDCGSDIYRPYGFEGK